LTDTHSLKKYSLKIQVVLKMFAVVVFLYSKIVKIVPSKWIRNLDEVNFVKKKTYLCFYHEDYNSEATFGRKTYSRIVKKGGHSKIYIVELFGK
jgi:hypothetical protein